MPLNNLEGVSEETIECEFTDKSSEIKAILDRGLAVTTGHDNGAINIWKDDNGNIRCEAMRHCQSLDKQIFKKMTDVRTWFDRWIKIIKK